jgi:membrane glycosyltransferase
LVDVPREGAPGGARRLSNSFKSTFSAPTVRKRRRATTRWLPGLTLSLSEPETMAASSSAVAVQSVPPTARLSMPRQDLRRAPSRRFAQAPSGLGGRRALVFLGALAFAALFGGVLMRVLGRDGVSALEWVTIAISAVLGGWVGLGFISATAGFLAVLRERARPVARALAEPVGRTAILLPVYNEDPGLILAAAQAIAEDIRRVGHAGLYDLFILSDTRDEVIARDEATGLLRLRLRLGDGGPGVFYRRRLQNTDRKAGNIGDWTQSHGAAYDYMLVLDADSLMTGETIAALTAGMDADPRLGLLQTAPTIVGGETPFARLQQFASRLYGPVFARGQQWWSGDEGNYWGHNAIIRVAAFAESAGLPHLTGPRPFGGHILSHDFVEAALLRRRGWAVRTDAALGGSYEEAPPTLLDTAARDRRWCQGNLQHARVVGAAGLHWLSRAHLVMGIFAYLTPALWLMLLVTAAFVWPWQQLETDSAEFHQVTALFELALALLMAPKLMALGLALTSPRLRAGFGGGLRLCLGFIGESLAAIFTTPVMMVMQSVAVAEVALGRDSGWKPQRREGAELNRRDAWRAHRGHVLLGVAGGLGALFLSKYLLVWASPVFLSLTLSALLSLHTSKPRQGGGARRRDLFRIPEDETPPPVLTRATELRRRHAGEAGLRRRIEVLFRAAVPMYQFTAPRHARRETAPLDEAA